MVSNQLSNKDNEDLSPITREKNFNYILNNFAALSLI